MREKRHIGLHGSPLIIAPNPPKTSQRELGYTSHRSKPFS